LELCNIKNISPVLLKQTKKNHPHPPKKKKNKQKNNQPNPSNVGRNINSEKETNHENLRRQPYDGGQKGTAV